MDAPPRSGFAIVAAAIRDGLADLAMPALRRVLVRSLGVTLLLVAGLWALGTRAITGAAWDFAGAHPLQLPFFVDAVGWAAGLLSGLALMVALSFLIAPITTAVAGLFLDEIAEAIETARYPADPPGRALPLVSSLADTARFTATSLAVNLVCVVLLIVPGVNLVAFFLGNGFLIGREYATFVLRRLDPTADVRRFRAVHGRTAFLAGCAAAVMLAVPVVNLATPLAATAVMVHVVKRVRGSRPGAGRDR